MQEGKPKLTLQINSLEALERLIGGDGETELEIKRSVIEKFAVKHLKALVKDTVIEKVGQAIKNEVLQEFTEEVKTGSWSTKFVLNEKMQNLVKESLQYKIKSEVTNIIQQEIEAQQIKEKIKELIEKQADYIVGDLTNGTLEARLNKMVDIKLKEKLGLK